MTTTFDDKMIHYSNTLRDNGLMEGKMGACLYFFIVGKLQRKKHFTKQAEALLDGIFNTVSLSSQTNFGQGMAGIGWGIEYLIRNNLVKGNSDEILEDIDNCVLKVLTTDDQLGIELSDGLTGYLLYIIQRLKSKRTNDKSLSFELNRELLILILNRLDQTYLSSAHPITNDIQFDFLQNFPYLIRSLRFAYDLCLFNTKIERMTYGLISHFETSMHGLNTNKLHLALEIKLLSNKMSINKWERLIDNLLYTIDFNELVNEVDLQSAGFRNGLAGLIYLLQIAVQSLPFDNQYHDKASHVLSSLPMIKIDLPKENDELFVQKICLSNGIMGATLFELFSSIKKKRINEIEPFLI